MSSWPFRRRRSGRQAEAAIPSPHSHSWGGAGCRDGQGAGIWEWEWGLESGCARGWPGGAAQNARSVNADVSKRRGAGKKACGGADTRCTGVRWAPFLHARRDGDGDGIARVWSRAWVFFYLSSSLFLFLLNLRINLKKYEELYEVRDFTSGE